jgi:hypothetical protein
VLTDTFRGERIAGHPVVISIVRLPADVQKCHLLFIGTRADETGELQKAAAHEPILTVGESQTFEKRGGIVRFVAEANRIRFDVNQKAAAAANLRLSSKVLQVARSVS